jgi:hypothetical protein
MFLNMPDSNTPSVPQGARKVVRTISSSGFWKFSALTCLVLFAFSCKKETEISTATASIEWTRVLQDTITFSSDDDLYLGRNGKVITDPADNMYVYYYASDRDQAIVGKYDPEGTLLWKKTFESCKPLDMARRPDGTLILAASLTGQVPNFLTLYSIKTDGTVEAKNDTLKDVIYSSSEIVNATISPMEDNSIVVSGVWKTYIAGSNFNSFGTSQFVFKNTPSLINEWAQYFGFCFTCPYTPNVPGRAVGTSAVALTTGGQYLVQFDRDADSNGDPSGHSLLTVLLNAGGIPDTSFNYNTSIYNRYVNGFMKDYGEGYISLYSSPRVGGQSSQAVPAAFLRIGEDARVHDTIPVSIPKDYRIVSCARGASGFMLSAYKAGAANGAVDFSGGHTLFLKGGSNWYATESFTLQEFYSDYFFSHAPVSNGSFVSMGRIQSFDGPVNKLMLIKWKN